ncbi:MAG TPA: HAMP domain-containing sensor histidine kinase [Candidatus Binatia bacterium]|jgi:signal transduction histidine kinase
MQTTLRETKFNGVPIQDLATNEPTPATPSKTVPAASVFLGLAHLIHQISNPIQAVYGAAGLLDQEMAKARGEDPFVAQVFQQLRKGVDQLISLVSSLRSQLDSLSLTDPDSSLVNLNSLIDDILQSEEARFDAGGIQVRKFVAANLPPIQANEKLLKEAFVNLLRNAADAMPEGGVLSVRAGACGSSVSFELADTGGGIPPDLDVFQPFATSKPGAMGLGLAITRHIVETHDGTITYRSQPGKGTTFCLTFPWAPQGKNVSV